MLRPPKRGEGTGLAGLSLSQGAAAAAASGEQWTRQQENRQTNTQTHKMDNPFFRRFANIFWTRLANIQKLNKTNTQGQPLQLKKSGHPGDESSFLKQDSDRDHRY